MTGRFKDDNDRLRAGVLPTDHKEGTRPVEDVAAKPWPELVPFDRPSVPAFPTEVLPDWQRHLVEAAALETETASDLGAMAVLSATATALQRKVLVEQRPGFTQVLALWTLSLLKSGGRKSRVFSLATEPLEGWQIATGEALTLQIAERASAKRRLELQLKRAEKAAAEAKDPEQRRAEGLEADRYARDLAEFEVASAPVLFVTEATPERLEELLAEQGERMAVLSDENGMIELLSGRYSKGAPNLSGLNTAHDGGRVRVARKRRDDGTGGDRMLEHATVTFGLSAQPERVLSELRGNSAFFDSGFAWRFLFAMVPSTLGERNHRTPTTPADVRARYAEGLTDLLDIPVPQGLNFPIIHPTTEATEALLDWEARVQEPCLREGGELALLQSWGSKLASRLCRIAALFHCAEHRIDPWETALELSTMDRALSLAPYFIAHAQAVAFDLHADPQMALARKALAWIRRNRKATFTRRELHKAIANNDAGEVLDRPLQILVERGFVRLTPRLAGETGRPSTDFQVNPAALVNP